ncbi:MAG: protoglobin domain-containing protein [Nostocaceae cyanobacterium]|nr:protoglobin domain-containing protein [Nostocaceae cyanobacterium]
MTLDPHAFLNTLKTRVNLTDEDKSLLQSYADWGATIAPDMSKAFYAYLNRDEEMNKILNQSEERVHRLYKTFTEWFAEMFTGMDEWGPQYANRRWKIGLVHVRIGIGPQHVVPAMATVVQEVSQRLKTDDKPEELKNALGRICMIDLAFIEQAYVEVSSSAVLRETGWTEALFKRLIAYGANTI